MASDPVVIYSDGACLGNPGRGGYGTVMLFGDHRKELHQGFRLTTNNRMELLGAIVGLEALSRPCSVDLYSDSTYVVNAMSKGWLAGWRRRGWKTASKQPVKNQDLWQRMVRAVGDHDVRWHWVKGHSGDPENERCDTLAVAAANGAGLLEDDGFGG
ncbi:MAG: ribonuclease HI [Planctomycetota bacterium]|nr:ribonuclease HI [Planctomycetota bacterium]